MLSKLFRKAFWAVNAFAILSIIPDLAEAFTGTFTCRELNVFIGIKVITTPLDTNGNIAKTDKLAGITEMALSLDELDNTDNLTTWKTENSATSYLGIT